MNKFQIIWEPVSCPVNGRTNQHFNHEQTMVFRINTRTRWNLIYQFPRINTVSIVITIWIHPVFHQTLSNTFYITTFGVFNLRKGLTIAQTVVWERCNSGTTVIWRWWKEIKLQFFLNSWFDQKKKRFLHEL